MNNRVGRDGPKGRRRGRPRLRAPSRADTHRRPPAIYELAPASSSSDSSTVFQWSSQSVSHGHIWARRPRHDAGSQDAANSRFLNPAARADAPRRRSQVLPSCLPGWPSVQRGPWRTRTHWSLRRAHSDWKGTQDGTTAIQSRHCALRHHKLHESYASRVMIVSQ